LIYFYFLANIINSTILLIIENMRNPQLPRLFFIVIIGLFIGTCFFPSPSTLAIDHISGQYPTITGQILFAPMYSGTTYLIDYTGAVNHSWSSDYTPGESVYWLGNYTILRSIKTQLSGYGGSGGGLQKILGDGSISWDYRYDSNGCLSHHDFKLLPNGNVLMIAWETKTREDAIEAGRDPNTFLGDSFSPDHIIEVKQTGPSSGQIVWQWHAWDHLIQDFDSNQHNYGNVAMHPELIDINYGSGQVSGDWLHSNSIDYNEDLDQILISVRNFNEVWVIDHSTTTVEAAKHTGGNSGKGGDLLYRWGNPQAYRIGTANNKKLFSQHDATWIQPGCPGAGHILVFNNGMNRPYSDYSTVDEIVPPINDSGLYYRAPGTSYEPESPLWSYMGNPPQSFFARGFSSAERLEDGNTLICNGPEGRFFEVTPEGTTVWEYVNPYPSPGLTSVFKIDYIPPKEPTKGSHIECTGVLSWTDVKPGQTVNGSFQVQNIGDPGSLLKWRINTSLVTWGAWIISPLSGEDLTPEEGPVNVQVSVTAPSEENKAFDGFIRVENEDNATDFGVISVSLTTSQASPLVIFRFPIFQHFLTFFLERYPFFEKMIGSHNLFE
jgi:hypothetical protein